MPYGPDHPLHYSCPTCHAQPQKHCRSRFGRIIKGYERIHSARHRKANRYIHGL